MSAPGNVSFISRFALKFVEIVAAGLATAASGYLVAHLSGILSSPLSPPAPAPNATVATTANGTTAPGPAPQQPPQSIAPTATETTQVRPAQEPEAPRTAAPARRIVNSAKVPPASKHVEKALEGAEAARDQDSLAAVVRAALANADAKRADAADSALVGSLPSLQSGSFAARPAPVEQPRALGDRSNPTVISPARSSAPELRPAPAVEANPPAAIETTSRPITTTQSSPTSAKDPDRLSILEQMLRHDPVANADEAPRPPLPVGQ